MDSLSPLEKLKFKYKPDSAGRIPDVKRMLYWVVVIRELLLLALIGHTFAYVAGMFIIS